MKVHLLVVALMLFSTSIFAQKVDIKKGTVTVDKSPYLLLEKEFGKHIMKTLGGEPLATLTYYTYDAPNPARLNKNNPNRYDYPATIKKTFINVEFMNIDLSFETDISKKKMFEAFYNYDLIVDSKVHEENAKKIEKLIGKEISENTPGILISY